jgi:zinc protease
LKSLALVVLLLCPALPARAQPLSPPRWVSLRNGLRLLLAPDSTAAAVDVGVWYPAGSGIEPAGQSGITHAVEHLMFRGSAHVGPLEHARRIQGGGGTANAMTTADYTCTWESVPPDALPLVFELEADRIGALQPTAAALATEQRAIAEERQAHSEGNPLARGLEQLYLAAYPDHPYRWPVIGAPADMAHIDLAACQAWLGTRYGPEHALVTVVGRFDPAEALALAKRWLEPLRRSRRGRDAPAVPPPAATPGPRASAVRADVPVPVVAMAWQGPGHADPAALPLALLAGLISGQPGAPLDRELIVQKRDCLQVQTGFDSRRQATLFYAVAAVRPGADSAAVERDLAAAVERFAREPLPADELERALRREDAATLFAWQSAHRRAEALGAAALVDGDPDAALTQLTRLRSLTPADVQAAAQRVLDPAHRTVVWLSPARAGGGR